MQEQAVAVMAPIATGRPHRVDRWFYDDLSAAFDFVSFAAPMEHQAFISLDTGTIYWISELNPLEEDVPEDLERRHKRSSSKRARRPVPGARPGSRCSANDSKSRRMGPRGLYAI
jgi:hypothetical protein